MDFLLTDPLGQLLAGLGVVIACAAVFAGMAFVGTKGSLWHHLPRQFPGLKDRDGEVCALLSACLHQAKNTPFGEAGTVGNIGVSSFNGTLKSAVGKKHLHLVMAWPLSLLYPPTSIPWSRVSSTHREGIGREENLWVMVSSSPPLALSFPMHQSGEALLRAAGDRLKPLEEGAINGNGARL